MTDAERRNRVRRIMLDIRRRNPWPDPSYSTAGFFRIPVTRFGAPYQFPLGFIGTTGCAWAKSGGCTVCDYGGFSGPVADETLMRQVDQLLAEWHDDTEINLSALGSFFDDKELSPSIRAYLLEAVRATGRMELVGIESRVVDVTSDRLQTAVAALGGEVSLEVGMGLESANDFIRNVCINKGVSLARVERAVREVKAAGAEAVLHVLLKPPFLTEDEAIADAVETIEYAAGLGVKRIVLMASNVKKGTLLGWLHERGYYRPPWLWSIFEVLRRLGPEARTRVLVYGFKCGLPMEDVAHNCPHCDAQVRPLIDEFCGTHDDALLSAAAEIQCRCRDDWNGTRNLGGDQTIRERFDALCAAYETEMSPES